MLALFKVRVCIGYNYNHGGSVVCTKMMETVKVKVCEIFNLEGIGSSFFPFTLHPKMKSMKC